MSKKLNLKPDEHSKIVSGDIVFFDNRKYNRTILNVFGERVKDADGNEKYRQKRQWCDDE